MPSLEEGQMFERYRIIRLLGSGTAGESYEAEDVMLQRKVVLKLIQPWSPLADAARRQFFREMQGLSALTHPGLTSVLDYGELRGKLYIARRYLSSGSLLSNDGRLWFSPPLNLTEAIHYGHQLASALEAIHRSGYIHGALTLSNILVLRGPNVEHDPNYAPFLIADSGLAHFVRRFGKLRNAFLPVTAAPELLSRRVNAASDQFSLATILYSWLTGRPPFLGAPEEVARAKQAEQFPALMSLNPRINLSQEGIMRRALSAQPEERYPSILAFADALLATTRVPVYDVFADIFAQAEQEAKEKALRAEQLAVETSARAAAHAEDLKPPVPIADELTFVEESAIESVNGSEGALLILSSSPPIESPEPSVNGSEMAVTPILLSSQPVEVPAELVSAPEKQPEDEVAIPTEEVSAPISQEGETATSQVAEMPSHEESALPNQLSEPELVIASTNSLQVDPEPLTTPPAQPEPLPTPPLQPDPHTLPGPVPVPTPQVIPKTDPEPVPVPDPEPQPFVPPAPTPLVPPIPQPQPEPAPMPISNAYLELLRGSAGASSPQPEVPEPVIEARQPRLVISSPMELESRTIWLEQAEITLGRAGASDILLDQDDLTSRHHALLKREGDGPNYLLFDRRSATGVQVNEHALEPEQGYLLHDGDIISIGRYQLCFYIGISQFNNLVTPATGPESQEAIIS